jgi:hypothetical protein
MVVQITIQIVGLSDACICKPKAHVFFHFYRGQQRRSIFLKKYCFIHECGMVVSVFLCLFSFMFVSGKFTMIRKMFPRFQKYIHGYHENQNVHWFRKLFTRFKNMFSVVQENWPWVWKKKQFIYFKNVDSSEKILELKILRSAWTYYVKSTYSWPLKKYDYVCTIYRNCMSC